MRKFITMPKIPGRTIAGVRRRSHETTVTKMSRHTRFNCLTFTLPALLCCCLSCSDSAEVARLRAELEGTKAELAAARAERTNASEKSPIDPPGQAATATVANANKNSHRLQITDVAGNVLEIADPYEEEYLGVFVISGRRTDRRHNGIEVSEGGFESTLAWNNIDTIVIYGREFSHLLGNDRFGPTDHPAKVFLRTGEVRIVKLIARNTIGGRNPNGSDISIPLQSVRRIVNVTPGASAWDKDRRVAIENTEAEIAKAVAIGNVFEGGRATLPDGSARRFDHLRGPYDRPLVFRLNDGSQKTIDPSNVVKLTFFKEGDKIEVIWKDGRTETLNDKLPSIRVKWEDGSEKTYSGSETAGMTFLADRSP